MAITVEEVEHGGVPDPSLLERARSGDPVAVSAVVESQVLLVWHVVHRFVRVHGVPQGCLDDVFQDGCMGLMKAIRSYDGSRGASWSTYACVAIHNEIVQGWERYRTACSGRRIPGQRVAVLDVVSLDEVMGDDDDCSLRDLISDPRMNTEDAALSRIELAAALSRIRSRDERAIVILRAAGYTPREIGRRLGLKGRSVAVYASRARRRIRDYRGIGLRWSVVSARFGAGRRDPSRSGSEVIRSGGEE